MKYELSINGRTVAAGLGEDAMRAFINHMGYRNFIVYNSAGFDKTEEFDMSMLPEEPNLCSVCGGEGFIMAWEGDGSDWGEDTYSGPMDESIECRHCKGTGAIL